MNPLFKNTHKRNRINNNLILYKQKFKDKFKQKFKSLLPGYSIRDPCEQAALQSQQKHTAKPRPTMLF